MTRAEQVRALAHPLRTTVLGLLAERAASVAELAQATGRPKGTVAHHVGVLHRAGLVQVVRTRRVRAVEERFYGRAARTVTIAVRARPAHRPERLRRRRDRVRAAPRSSAGCGRSSGTRGSTPTGPTSSGLRIRDLVEEFDRLPRSGDTTYGMAVGIYPVEGHPRLPRRDRVRGGSHRGPA